MHTIFSIFFEWQKKEIMPPLTPRRPCCCYCCCLALTTSSTKGNWINWMTDAFTYSVSSTSPHTGPRPTDSAMRKRKSRRWPASPLRSLESFCCLRWTSEKLKSNVWKSEHFCYNYQKFNKQWALGVLGVIGALKNSLFLRWNCKRLLYQNTKLLWKLSYIHIV